MVSSDVLLVKEGDNRNCSICGNPFFLHKECNYHRKFLNTPVLCFSFIGKLDSSLTATIPLKVDPTTTAAFDPAILASEIFDVKTDDEKIRNLNNEIDSQVGQIRELHKTIKDFNKSNKEQKKYIKELIESLYTVTLAKNGLQKMFDSFISDKK